MMVQIIMVRTLSIITIALFNPLDELIKALGSNKELYEGLCK